jgi:hypothetical protein
MVDESVQTVVDESAATESPIQQFEPPSRLTTRFDTTPTPSASRDFVKLAAEKSRLAALLAAMPASREPEPLDVEPPTSIKAPTSGATDTPSPRVEPSITIPELRVSDEEHEARREEYHYLKLWGLEPATRQVLLPSLLSVTNNSQSPFEALKVAHANVVSIETPLFEEPQKATATDAAVASRMNFIDSLLHRNISDSTEQLFASQGLDGDMSLVPKPGLGTKELYSLLVSYKTYFKVFMSVFVLCLIGLIIYVDARGFFSWIPVFFFALFLIPFIFFVFPVLSVVEDYSVLEGNQLVTGVSSGQLFLINALAGVVLILQYTMVEYYGFIGAIYGVFTGFGIALDLRDVFQRKSLWKLPILLLVSLGYYLGLLDIDLPIYIRLGLLAIDYYYLLQVLGQKHFFDYYSKYRAKVVEFRKDVMTDFYHDETSNTTKSESALIRWGAAIVLFLGLTIIPLILPIFVLVQPLYVEFAGELVGDAVDTRLFGNIIFQIAVVVVGIVFGMTSFKVYGKYDLVAVANGVSLDFDEFCTQVSLHDRYEKALPRIYRIWLRMVKRHKKNHTPFYVWLLFVVLCINTIFFSSMYQYSQNFEQVGVLPWYAPIFYLSREFYRVVFTLGFAIVAPRKDIDLYMAQELSGALEGFSTLCSIGLVIGTGAYIVAGLTRAGRLAKIVNPKFQYAYLDAIREWKTIARLFASENCIVPTQKYCPTCKTNNAYDSSITQCPGCEAKLVTPRPLRIDLPPKYSTLPADATTIDVRALPELRKIKTLLDRFQVSEAWQLFDQLPHTVRDNDATRLLKLQVYFTLRMNPTRAFPVFYFPLLRVRMLSRKYPFDPDVAFVRALAELIVKQDLVTASKLAQIIQLHPRRQSTYDLLDLVIQVKSFQPMDKQTLMRLFNRHLPRVTPIERALVVMALGKVPEENSSTSTDPLIAKKLEVYRRFVELIMAGRREASEVLANEGWYKALQLSLDKQQRRTNWFKISYKTMHILLVLLVGAYGFNPFRWF